MRKSTFEPNNAYPLDRPNTHIRPAPSLTFLTLFLKYKIQFDNLQELIYVESHLSNTATKFYGELTQQMLKLSDAPGSDNGTGFFQTLTALKLREIYEKITSKSAAAVSA